MSGYYEADDANIFKIVEHQRVRTIGVHEICGTNNVATNNCTEEYGFYAHILSISILNHTAVCLRFAYCSIT